MRLSSLSAAFLCLILVSACGAKDPDWREIEPDNLLVIDTNKGRVLIEMRPDLAPQTVARVRELARAHAYDNRKFFRVIDGFMAQTGSPDDTPDGTTKEPNLPHEFSAKIDAQPPRPDDEPMTPEDAAKFAYTSVVTRSDGTAGFLGTMPVETTSAFEDARRKDGKTQVWATYCPGVVAMARDEGFDTANSQFFIMRGAARRLDRLYAAWGMVVDGLDVAYKLNSGEPPAQPDIMLKVQVASDMSESARPSVKAMTSSSVDFLKFAGAIRAQKRADFSICDLKVGVQVTDGGS